MTQKPIHREGSTGNRYWCEECAEDTWVEAKREPDARCLHCGMRLCGGHIASHLANTHGVSLNVNYIVRDPVLQVAREITRREKKEVEHAKKGRED